MMKVMLETSHLEANLPSEATTYNKTGENSRYGVRNDAQIVESPHGRYVLVVLSEDGQEADQIQVMQAYGRAIYDALSRHQAANPSH